MTRESRNKLLDFFKEYPPLVQKIVKRVLEIEQEQIDMKRPRVKEDIRELFDREGQAR